LNSKIKTTDWIDRDLDLIVTCTSHRIVFLAHSDTPSTNSTSNRNSTPRQAHFLHHCAILIQESTGGNWTTNRSFKIQIETVTHGTLLLIFRNGKKDRDVFAQTLEKALFRRQWEETYRQQMHLISSETRSMTSNTIMTSTTTTSTNMTTITSSKVGVDKIIEQNRQRHERAQQLTQDAFLIDSTRNKDVLDKEVETLFKEAKELTSIIHKYAATLEKTRQEQQSLFHGNQGMGSINQQLEEDGQQQDTIELTSMLQGMGMVTAISKDVTSSSDEYHEMLARQLVDFLSQHPSFSGTDACGIMILTDVYCLYNRARGANMISPDDLIQSLELLEKLGLRMKLRELEGSGVKVLQKSDFDDEIMAEKILAYIESVEVEHPNTYIGLTALEASRVLKISPLLANEMLLSSERNGELCRDVTIEGTRFFRNAFMTF
jgi:ESCRT-II complex subunit VPS36